MSNNLRNKKFLIEILGWYGMLAILLAYALNSLEFIASTSFIYQTLNLTGAFGLMAIAYYKHVWQSVTLNLIWLVVAIIALVNLL